MKPARGSSKKKNEAKRFRTNPATRLNSDDDDDDGDDGDDGDGDNDADHSHGHDSS